jgi:hypothetical protein
MCLLRATLPHREYAESRSVQHHPIYLGFVESDIRSVVDKATCFLRYLVSGWRSRTGLAAVSRSLQVHVHRILKSSHHIRYGRRKEDKRSGTYIGDCSCFCQCPTSLRPVANRLFTSQADVLKLRRSSLHHPPRRRLMATWPARPC